MLDDNDPSTRREGIKALGKIGKPAAPAITALVRTLADPNAELRHAAAVALRSIDRRWAGSRAAQEAVPKLTEAAKASDDGVRRAAEGTLDQIDPDHRLHKH